MTSYYQLNTSSVTRLLLVHSTAWSCNRFEARVGPATSDTLPVLVGV